MSFTKTISEQLFEDFCTQRGFRLEKIPESTERTPDYDLFVNDIQIVVEVKQIDPNKDDITAQNDLVNNPGKVVFISDSPGNRVRSLVNKAAGQISKRAKGKHPSLLVLYNNAEIADYLNDYSIKTGMFGIEKVVFNVSQNIDSQISVLDRAFGPKRKMTPTNNTSISAVAVIKTLENNFYELAIYHNPFAAMPLAPSVFNFPNIKQFIIENKRDRQFQLWKSIKFGSDLEIT